MSQELLSLLNCKKKKNKNSKKDRVKRAEGNFLKILFIFNWGIIALQYCVGFCHTSTCIGHAAAAAAKSLQSCPTLCDPIDGSPPGSPVPGILQARTLEWVAIFFSNVWQWKVKVKSLSHVRLLATPWTTAYQAPPSMGFSRQEYWSRVPLPSPCIGHRYIYILSLLSLPPTSHTFYSWMLTVVWACYKKCWYVYKYKILF